MWIEEPAPKPVSASRVSLAILTGPGEANPFGTIHGGVLLRLADECGGMSALRHAGRGQITTAAIDSMTFMRPVFVGERIEVCAEVTYVGRTSIETRIEIFAEPFEQDLRRKVAVGYAVYVALDSSGRSPRRVPALLLTSDAERLTAQEAKARQAIRLERRAQARAQQTERGTG
jgi:uncharacterized protein (TIGR00369 family)